MNGAIMVLPRDGLKDGQGNPLRYDRVYYVGEQDFYVPRDEAGNYKTYEYPGDSYADALEVMRTLTPTHIVFNGAGRRADRRQRADGGCRARPC
jgi:nitrite reductase (NO-forming)